MGEVDVTVASNKLAKAQEVAALKGLRAAIPFYVDATDALAQEERFDAAVGVLAEVLNARERKRSLFGSKEINPLGPDRIIVARQFAKLTRGAHINDDLLELLGALAVENPDDPEIRIANAEGLYRGGYMADAIDEYRYCEKLSPDDGVLVARLGELYGIMSRNVEAVEHLSRGIGEMMQSQRYQDVPFFAHKLIEVAPQSANDVQRWLESLPEETLRTKRDELVHLLDALREKGLDDGRWSSLEKRLDELPPVEDRVDTSDTARRDALAFAAEPQLAAPVEEEVADAQPAHADIDEIEPEPEPVWGSKTGNVAIGRGWDDITSVEPASEDEMRMLLGPSSASEKSGEREPARAPESTKPAAASSGRNGTPIAPVQLGRTTPASAPPTSGAAAAAPALPPGLAAFTRRKADAALNAGDFAGAAQSYERLLKSGFSEDVAASLLECYLGTERFSEAAALGLQLADHQADEGQLEKAIATLALVLEHTQDPDVERRHSELAAAN